MAEQATQGRRSIGPGNRVMAAALLETLTLRGRLADRERAAKSARLDEQPLIDSPVWLESDTLLRMLSSAGVDVPVARALGHRLVAPESVGLPLYMSGMATPEKAYRRIETLLPREAAEAKWITEEIQDESARISYQPDPIFEKTKTRPPPAVLAASCALRLGMLEARHMAASEPRSRAHELSSSLASSGIGLRSMSGNI